MVISERSPNATSQLTCPDYFYQELNVCADVVSIIIHLRKGTLLRLRQRLVHLDYPSRCLQRKERSELLAEIFAED